MPDRPAPRPARISSAGATIADIDRELPLSDGTYVIDDPSANGDYRLEVKTTVLDHYDPLP